MSMNRLGPINGTAPKNVSLLKLRQNKKAAVKSFTPDKKEPGLVSVDFSDPERLRFLEALNSTKYKGVGRRNLSVAARQLDIPRKTFTYRLRKMQLIW